MSEQKKDPGSYSADSIQVLEGLEAVRRVKPDLVLLSDMILQGDFVHAPNAWWNRRDVRNKESHSERMKRYTNKEFGQATGSISRRFPLLQLPFALIGVAWKARIPFLQRALVLLLLIPQLPVRYIAGKRKANQ